MAHLSGMKLSMLVFFLDDGPRAHSFWRSAVRACGANRPCMADAALPDIAAASPARLTK